LSNYSLSVAPFFKSCPSTNVQLPVKAFPPLAVTSASYKAGSTINLKYEGKDGYFAIYSGKYTSFIIFFMY